jgi:hypothetical protein
LAIKVATTTTGMRVSSFGDMGTLHRNRPANDLTAWDSDGRDDLTGDLRTASSVKSA